MTRPQAAINRFFLDSDYSIYYRKAQKFAWQNQVTANYGLLSVQSGELDCVIGDRRFRISESQSLVIEPNQSITAKSKHVEFLYLTLAASLVLEHALEMQLVASKSMVVKFTSLTLDSNERLSNITRMVVSELMDEEPGKEFVIRALVGQLLVHLLRR